ncbi:hypothetical protein MYOV003v1_p0099 [Vibrio phage 207E48.1]|nr:hypothetical protein MYOV003v1_p0099 [Vibrio phage 207E48.1]
MKKTYSPLAQCHLLEILRLQIETNELYDPKWRDNNTQIQFRTAASNEITEMHDEIETLWKWYTPNPTWEPQKALFELVDAVHFAASCILINRRVGVEDGLLTYELNTTPFTADDTFSEATDWWMSFNHHLGMNPLLVQPCESLCYFIGAMLATLGYTQEEYMRAHYLKNERNRARATGGVMVGTYDKSAETPLEL